MKRPIILEIFAFLTIISLSGSCSGPRESGASEKAMIDYKALAISKLPQPHEFLENKTKTHMLCIGMAPQSKTAPYNPQPISFFIFEMATSQIIHEGQIDNGKVYWKSNQQVAVEMVPGTIDEGAEPEFYGYIFDVHEKAKIDFN